MKKSKQIIWWKQVNYKKIIDEEGTIGVIEHGNEINFNIKRIFYILGAKKNISRGNHSHRSLKQLMICLQGSFLLKLDNGKIKKEFKLNSLSKSIYIDGKVWREMSNFSKDCIILVLCDKEYKNDRVIDNYNEFKKIVSQYH